MRPHPTPSTEAAGGAVCSSIKTMLLDGKTVHHGGDVCELCALLAKDLLSKSFFVPARTDITVKLLSNEKKQDSKNNFALKETQPAWKYCKDGTYYF